MKTTILIALGCLLMAGCATNSSKPSDFVVENSVVKTRIKDPNMEREHDYQFASNIEFKTVSRIVGSKNAKMCEGFARQRTPMAIWLESCNMALAEPGLSARNRQASLFNRGLIHMNLDDIDAARSDFKQVLAEDPDFGDAWLSLGTIEANAQNYPKAREYGESALSTGLNQADRAYVLLGWVAEKEFDFPKARTFYQKALELKPGAGHVRRKLRRLNELWPDEGTEG